MNIDEQNILIIGANGQLGTALQQRYPKAKKADISELDITDSDSVKNFDWSGIKIILNAAAYTNVDGAETTEGRTLAWKVNATAVGLLARIAEQRDITLVHVSTDYVFDGTKPLHYENESFAPLSVYGASKAAGDIAVSLASQYYILRTSWVIGEGKNFVRTMVDLAKRGISPSVVSDQIGRLTFTTTLVDAIDHLLTTNAPYGTYNVTNDGDSVSWAAITREIFAIMGVPNDVTDTSTADYFADKPESAPRPLQSTLDLTEITKSGYIPTNWRDELKAYVSAQETTS